MSRVFMLAERFPVKPSLVLDVFACLGLGFSRAVVWVCCFSSPVWGEATMAKLRTPYTWLGSELIEGCRSRKD